MLNTPHDPTMGFLEFILCWSFYSIGTILQVINITSFPIWVNYMLQDISFSIAIILGILNVLKIVGVNVNFKHKFKKKS